VAPTLVTTPYFLESPAAPGASGDTSTLVTPSFTPVDEVILVKAQTWDKGTAAGTPSGGGLTYTRRVTIAPGVFATYGTIFTTVVVGTGSSMTITLSAPAAASYHSMVVERWSGAQLAATPATASANYSAASAPSATITTAGANSVVSWLNGDAQSVAPTGTGTYLSGATNDGLANGTSLSNSNQYYAWQNAASAGSQTFGMSAPTGQKWAMCAIEVQAAAAATGFVAPPGLVAGQQPALIRASLF
jgi:hypothetical protein